MSESIVITRPDVTDLVGASTKLMRMAEGVAVVDSQTRESALRTAGELRKLSKQFTAHFEPSRKALDTAKKEILAARDAFVEPLENAVHVIDKKCGAWEAEEERTAAIIRRELEAKAEAERKRLMDEALAKQEEQRILDAAMASTEEEAQDAMTEPLPEPEVFVAPVVLAPAVETVAGASVSKTWVYDPEATDKAAALVFIAANPWAHYIVNLDAVALNHLARAHEGKVPIPGIACAEKSHRTFRS